MKEGWIDYEVIKIFTSDDPLEEEYRKDVTGKMSLECTSISVRLNINICWIYGFRLPQINNKTIAYLYAL